MKAMKITFALIVLALFAGCQTYSDDQKNEFDDEIQAYIKKKGLDLERSESGLYFKIIDKGDGDEVLFRDKVSFKYRGEFLNGKVFDEQKEPIEYNVDILIGAWKEIMLELNEGGKAFIIAPPTLGYGENDLEAIPPNSILVYDLEVIEAK